MADEFGISTTTLRRWLKAAKAQPEAPAEPDTTAPEAPTGDPPSDQLQLVVIDTAGDVGRIARILRNERLSINITRLSEHAFADKVASHFSWRENGCVLDLDAAGVRRVFNLLQRSGRPLPRVLVSSSGQFPGSDPENPPGDAVVITPAATALLAPFLDRECQVAELRARMADCESHVRQLHSCYQRTFDGSSEPVAIIGVAGHRYANPAYLRLFNYPTLADARDAQFTRLVADRSMQDYLKAIDHLDAAGKTTRVDIALQSGARVHTEVTRLPGAARELLLHVRSVAAASASPALSRPGAGDIARSLVQTTSSVGTAQPAPERENQDTAECKDRIRRALRDPNHFSLLYQPIVGLSGGPSHMYEALLRLRDSNGTEYLPGQFIPVAEEAGLMPLVDKWVVTRAIKTIKSQIGLDATVTICVNLSLASLQDKTFPDWLRTIVATADIAPGRLVLEIARADLIPDLTAAQRALRALRAIGCAIILDDFCIDSADSELLSVVSVDFVKLDRSLVLEVARSDTYHQRIQHLVKVAGKAGVKTIAAYVQEAASVSRLWSCGVDYVQGYFLQHPSQALDYDFGGEEHEVPSNEWALL